MSMDRAARVLVVEDDDEIAQVLQRSLRLEGYDVKLAGDGVQALDEVHAFLPDIIVLDLGLPRMPRRPCRPAHGRSGAAALTWP
jgi:DNA-binding response OmpR family regulator